MEKIGLLFSIFVQETRETRLLTPEDKLAVLVFCLDRLREGGDRGPYANDPKADNGLRSAARESS
jgi:hypothetical protein